MLVILAAIITFLSTGQVVTLYYPAAFESMEVCEAVRTSETNATALEHLRQSIVADVGEDVQFVIDNKCVEYDPNQEEGK